MEIAKHCSKCFQLKSVTEFYKANYGDGYRAQCKHCIAAWNKQYCIDNNEKIKERTRLYNQKPEVKERIKQYRINNIERIREREKLHNKKPERIEYCRKYNIEYRIKNKDRLKENVKSRRDEINQYERNKYHSDEQFRLARLLRSRIRFALKGIAKTDHTLNLLGCSIEHLYYWLTSQLQDGQKLTDMELDHNRPCSSFDLTNPAQQLMCCSWGNIMPLTKEENRKKSDKRDEELERKQKIKADSFKYETFNTPFGNITVTVSQW